jgi:tetratricopeptide (TPR) repeat protein
MDSVHAHTRHQWNQTWTFSRDARVGGVRALCSSRSASSALTERCRALAFAGSDLPLALADCNEALKHAVKSSPFFASTINSRALVMLRLGRYDKSIADFDASLKIDAKDAFSLYGRGVAENRVNQASAAEADMKKARDLSPIIADKFAKSGLLP